MYLAEIYNYVVNEYQLVYDLDGKTILAFDTREAASRFLCICRGIASGYVISPIPDGLLEQYKCRVIY